MRQMKTGNVENTDQNYYRTERHGPRNDFIVAGGQLADYYTKYISS